MRVGAMAAEIDSRSKCDAGGFKRLDAESLAVHAEKVSILMDGREQAVALTLELNAEQVDHVAARQDVVEPKGNFHSKPGNALRHQSRRSADDDFGAQFQEAVNIAPGYPAMGDVSDQADGQSLQPILDSPNGEDVEQSLSGMLVGAVAGIDDTALQMLCQEMRRAGHGVADHYAVDAHRFDVLGGVNEALAFGEAGASRGEVDRVSAQALGRKR